MSQSNITPFIAHVLDHLPNSWIDLTTHRLDIYEEKLAKTQFLQHFELAYGVHQ